MNVTLRSQKASSRRFMTMTKHPASTSQASLEEAGFVSPAWADLASGRAKAEPDHEEVEPNQPGGVAV